MSATLESVCVTGANGYVAAVLIEELLKRNYKVIGTVRSVEHVRHHHLLENIDLYQADLLNASSFDEPFRRCQALMHTASPFWFDFKPELIDHAVEGTYNVLKAAKRAGITRVVVTSSVAAITPQNPAKVLPKAGAGKAFTEDDWNMDSTSSLGPYRLSKRLAEQKLWEFAEGEGKGSHYAAINPSFVLGPPATSSDSGESISFMKKLIEGDFAETIPDMKTGVVDVRDVALAHIKAMELDEANGKRFLLSSPQMYSWLELATTLKTDSAMGFACPQVAQESVQSAVISLSSQQAKDVLGISLTPISTTLGDMATRLLMLGMVDTSKKDTLDHDEM